MEKNPINTDLSYCLMKIISPMNMVHVTNRSCGILGMICTVPCSLYMLDLYVRSHEGKLKVPYLHFATNCSAFTSEVMEQFPESATPCH